MRRYLGGNYCVAINLPLAWHNRADATLAVTMISGPLFLTEFVSQANQWLALFGGLVGTLIGCVRLYRLVRGRKNSGEDRDDS